MQRSKNDLITSLHQLRKGQSQSANWVVRKLGALCPPRHDTKPSV
jgi:hypothetical protein